MNRAAVVIIVKDKLILGISRRHDSSKYGLIGGKCDSNEAPWQAAIRETLEETSIQIDSLEYLFKDTDSDNYETFCFIALAWNGEPLSKEEGNVKWLKPHLLSDVAHGAFPEYNKKAIALLKDRYPDMI